MRYKLSEILELAAGEDTRGGGPDYLSAGVDDLILRGSPPPKKFLEEDSMSKKTENTTTSDKLAKRNPSTPSILPFLALFFFLTLCFFPSLFHFLTRIPLSLLPSSPAPATTSMSWTQKTFTLPSRSRGSYLITSNVESSLPEIKQYKVGLLNLFVQHTSCALSLNENWDEDVRADMSDALDRIAPEGKMYRHDAEGRDDMPAHIKSALIGASVTIPIKDGRLATGTWQGIWYLEFRKASHTRKVVATIQGEKSS